ncbi:hypothetical protein AKO1_012020 [Acrasis kona]|uniref:C2H2-type domain-containing protein n=1 Tax=Acrasis kona TaxID=1008807 RepID=A0AAW2ZCI7_9EUKA
MQNEKSQEEELSFEDLIFEPFQPLSEDYQSASDKLEENVNNDDILDTAYFCELFPSQQVCNTTVVSSLDPPTFETISPNDDIDEDPRSKKRKIEEKFNINIEIIRIQKGDDGQYTCDVCSKTFTDKSNLTKHIRVHTKEKPYQCEVCDKSFSHSQTLREHLFTHTSSSPYTCSVCRKSFTNDANLKRHMRTHTSEKPYKCTECGAEFTQSNNCKIHMSTRHGINVPTVKKS